MKVYVALLRAVNVGGNKLKMADLREALLGDGFCGVQTVLQSGNVIVATPPQSRKALEERIERALAEHLGARSEVFVRSRAEWQTIVDKNPFDREARKDPSHLLTFVLGRAPSPATEGAVQSAIVGREIVRLNGDRLYVYYPDGIGESKLTPVVIERHLGTRGTGRNWNTVLKLNDLISSHESSRVADDLA